MPRKRELVPAEEDLHEIPLGGRLDAAVDAVVDEDEYEESSDPSSPETAPMKRGKKAEEALPPPIAPSRIRTEGQDYETPVPEGVHVIDSAARNLLKDFRSSLSDAVAEQWKVAWWVMDPTTGKRVYITEYPLSLVSETGLEEFARRRFKGGRLHWTLRKGQSYARKDDLPPKLRESLPVSGQISLAGDFELPPELEGRKKSLDDMMPVVLPAAAPQFDIAGLMRSQADAFQRGMEIAAGKESKSSDVTLAMMQQMQQNFTMMMQSGQQQFQVFLSMLEAQRANSDNLFKMILDMREKDKDHYEHFIELASSFAGVGEKDEPASFGTAVVKAIPAMLDKVGEMTRGPSTVQTVQTKALPTPKQTDKEKPMFKLAEVITSEVETGLLREMPESLVADRLSYLIPADVLSKLASSSDEEVMGFLKQCYKLVRQREPDERTVEYTKAVLASFREGMKAVEAPEEAPPEPPEEATEK